MRITFEKPKPLRRQTVHGKEQAPPAQALAYSIKRVGDTKMPSEYRFSSRLSSDVLRETRAPRSNIHDIVPGP